MKPDFPRALRTAAFVLDTYCRNAPPLFAVDVDSDYNTGTLARVRLQLAGTDAVDVLDWAGVLGGRLRLYRHRTGDAFELAAVREIDGVTVHAWTIIPAEQAATVLHLAGGEYDQHRHAWLDVTEDTDHGIRLALLAVAA